MSKKLNYFLAGRGCRFTVFWIAPVESSFGKPTMTRLPSLRSLTIRSQAKRGSRQPNLSPTKSTVGFIFRLWQVHKSRMRFTLGGMRFKTWSGSRIYHDSVHDENYDRGQAIARVLDSYEELLKYLGESQS